MATFDNQTLEIVKRLHNVRMSLLSKRPFYALLLMKMKFALDETCKTVYTDGVRIAFNPEFLNEISDKELEFVMMHAVLHAALGHPFRKQSDYDLKCYDMACDIVVNSNILYSCKMNKSYITLKNYGVAMHKTPSGEEGYKFTVEQVYEQLLEKYGVTTKNAKESADTNDNDCDASDGEGDEDTEDLSDEQEGDDSDKCDGANSADGGDADGEAGENGDGDRAKQSSEGKPQSGRQSDGKVTVSQKVSSSGGCDENCAGKYDGKVLSGEKWCDENDYNLEALLSQMKSKNEQLKEKYVEELKKTKKDMSEEMVECIDDHNFWEGDDECQTMRHTWNDCVMQATEATLEKKESHKGYGGPPLCMVRMVKELTNPEVDWRTVLNEFVQEEVNDYSFSPPDRRMDDCPFFLPDFNEKDEKIKNVWFLIDTSGSIGDDAIEAAYSEIASALDMFTTMEGLLSFTEVFVTEPIPFCSIDELLAIKPIGGGGNNFGAIFKYMQKHMMDDLPTSIVILTDGYDYYPPEKEALGVPVFWLINNQDAEPPPWGRWARFKVNKGTKKGT